MRKNAILLALLMFVTIQLLAQDKTITGKIIDAQNGSPIEKATVAISKGKAKTFSGSDGSFKLASSVENGELFVTYTGYTPVTVKFSGNTTLEIKLQQDIKDMSEVVVTALNVSREKKRIGYTVSEVNPGLIEKSSEQNVIEALAGKVAGVQVTGASGTPGASSRIIVRGNSTFTGNNQCLVVVDGIPVDNSTFQPSAADPFVNLYGVQESNRAIDINPADIQSLTILKGPAAASLYGARGGNGAIIITTKKGRNNGKLGVTYSSSMEWSKVNKLPELQNQFLQGIGGISQPVQFSFGPKADTVDVPTYDKYSQFFKTGTIFTNNISIDGGTQNSSFRLGVGNSNNKGVIPNSKFERTNISFSAESKLKDWMTVGASANYVISSGIRVQNGNGRGGIMLTLLRAPINYNAENWIDAAGNEVKYFGAWDNPRFTAERNPYTDQTNRIFGNLYTNISFTKELSLDWRVGVDYFSTAAKQIYDLTSFANTNGNPGAGQVNFSNNSNRQIYSDVMLRYKKKLSSKLELNSFVGLNIWDNQYRFNFDRGTNLQVPGLYALDNTSALFATSNESYEQTKALFAEVSFNYNSFLNLTFTGRNDWTTAFGRGGGSFFYPKADLAWIFSEHIPANKILSYGKLRIAYADAGTGPKPYTYDNVVYYARPNYSDGSVTTAANTFPYLGQAGYAPLNIKYPGGLVPAHVIGKEVGMELKFLGNRINLDAVYYVQNSKDNLLQMPIAASTGYNYEYTNAGEIENKGIELSLGADVIKTNKLVWNISANWSKNTSKVLSLAPGVTQIELEKSLGSVGFYSLVDQPYGIFYGTTWKRNAEGKLLLNDLGQPIINSAKSGLGSPNPDWLMGISSSLTYNNVNLSFLVDIRQGGLIYNGTWASLSQYGLTDESADRDKTYIIDGVYDQTASKPGEQNTTAVTSTYYFQTYKGASGATENAMQDGSWVRLRSVSLGYRFDKFKTKAISYIDISVSGRNLWLSTKYKGVDPETSLTGAGSNISGIDWFNNPGTKSYGIALKMGF